MAFTKSESIQLASGETIEHIKSRISPWQTSEVGRSYSLKNSGPNFFVIEKRWTPSWKYIFLCFGILPGLCCIMMSKTYVKFTITVTESVLNLSVESNYRSTAEDHFSSLFYTLSGSGTSTDSSFQ
ncbi:MAG: hypothetical protein ACTSV2_00725 [Candidatus Thorarchaeota archaeon]